MTSRLVTRSLAAAALVAAISGAVPTAIGHAGGGAPACPLKLTAGSPITPPGGKPFIVCSGKVRSFDGTPLDVDVTIPDFAYQTTHGVPLIGFMHGWGNSKTEWESTTLQGPATDKYHWNNAWFASMGDVVLTYSARGFHLSCGKDSSGYSYAHDSTCSDTTGEKSWTHLADRRWEIHDFQYLAGLLVDAPLGINPKAIVATGGSYGGGQSWDLALSQDQVVASTSTNPVKPGLAPWVSPHKHIAMHLAAALPMYPWTDLEDALVSNGTASDGFHGAPADGTHGSPYGVDKQSYVDGLYALGQTSAQYASPGVDTTADLSTWFAGINAGEPYSANPQAQAAATQVGGAFRSPLRMPIPAPAHQIPVYVIQGFTDPLFPSLQALDMINHLRAAYPSYPVWAFLGDVGHSYANNPLDVWQQAHAASNAWLQSILGGHAPTQPRLTADTTRCVAGQTLNQYAGANFGAIATSTLGFTGAAAQTSASSNAATSEGTRADPIANAGCRTMAASQSDPNQASYTFSLSSASTLVGGPVVHVTAAISGSSAEVAARLWDIDASGNQTLLSRSVYRLEEGSSGTTTVSLWFEMWPNAWQLQCGHHIKLELTQDDSPTWRPDNEASSITFTKLGLTLPVVLGPVC